MEQLKWNNSCFLSSFDWIVSPKAMWLFRCFNIQRILLTKISNSNTSWFEHPNLKVSETARTESKWKKLIKYMCAVRNLSTSNHILVNIRLKVLLSTKVESIYLFCVCKTFQKQIWDADFFGRYVHQQINDPVHLNKNITR